MKKFASVVALLALQAVSTLSNFTTGSTLYAQDCNVEISTMHTSHLIFATDLTYVDISSKVIAAKIVESSKNILALKARNRSTSRPRSRFWRPTASCTPSMFRMRRSRACSSMTSGSQVKK